MKLLSNIDRALSSKNGKGQEPSRVIPATGDQGDIAGSIGERYETLYGGLDRLGGLFEQVKGFEAVLSEMRVPLQAEHEARRADYVELINLRSAHAEAQARVQQLTDGARSLTDARDDATRRFEETVQKAEEHAASLQDAKLETDRLRTALSKAEAEAQGLRDVERDQAQRIGRLEQDIEAVRTQLSIADGARAEAVTGRAAIQRDHALAVEENTALKKRVDEAVTEIARLARVEAALDGQLTTERNRSTAREADAARAAQALESQVETARAAMGALQVRLDTVSSRADRLDKLNGDLSTALNEAQGAAQTGDRKAGHLQTDLDRAAERIRELETQAEENRQRLTALEAARLAAVDRVDHLTKAASVAERALTRSDERANKLQAALTDARNAAESQGQMLTDQIEALRARLGSVEADAAMTAAALDTARRDRFMPATDGSAA